MFKLWSENNKQARDFLKPDLGFRSWNDLEQEEKDRIWRYLKWYFFSVVQTKEYYRTTISYESYEFYGGWDEKKYKQETISKTISYISENFKAKSFANTFLKNSNLDTACYDFCNIFMKQDEMAVMELFSAYAKFFYEFTKNNGYIHKEENESDEDFLDRKIKFEFRFFDAFAKRLNDVFLQFGIKYYLTRDGFIPRQDQKIIEEIYEPVISCLSDKKWKKVNEILADSFTDYRKNIPQGYSGCVTKTISAVEAFMQILVENKIGGAKLSPLIAKAQKDGFIPNDIFTQTIFKNIDSIFARERMNTGDGHPKEEYATEKNARTMLNLAMIFLQHCIQN